MSKSAEAHVSAATEKMGVVEKLGFMTFSMSDNIVYQFKAIYYMFFLTNVLGISVGTAGAVFAIGTVWDAVNDPLLGYMALNTRFKSGEKIRPFILYAVPWAVTIDPAHRIPKYADVATYHPLFLYESLYNLLVCSCLWMLDRSEKVKLKQGSLFLIYLIAYPVGRFFLEFLRLDTAQLGGINVNQTVMAVVAVCAAICLFMREKKK